MEQVALLLSIQISATRQLLPSAISADGSVIVGAEFTSSFRIEPIRWTTADGVTTLNTIGNSSDSQVKGVSGNR